MRVLLAVFLLAGLSSACVAVREEAPARASHPSPRHPSAASPATPECHPSQYWDGEQCRHKGQGRGARKHDG